MVDRQEITWAFIGSLVVASGITVTGLSAFGGELPFVMLGMVLFIAGYRVSQRGVTEPSDEAGTIEITGEKLVFWSLLVAGWFFLSVGVMLWAQTVINPSFTAATLAGISSIGGYTLSHLGINRNGLGQWLIELYHEIGESGVRGTVAGVFSNNDERTQAANPKTPAERLREGLQAGDHEPIWSLFAVSMLVTIIALASGAIWACGEYCLSDPLIWRPEWQVYLVFGLAMVTWWGYLLGHYSVAGTLIDSSSHGESTDDETNGIWRNPVKQGIGMAAGCGILVVGMVWGMLQVQAGNHLLTYIGSFLFLSGYMIAHTVDARKPL